MALAALISAIRDAEDGSGLVGTLSVAGRTLIERQARLAAQAGAARVVLLVERLPAGLTGAIDRLRRDGIAIDVARSTGDAADRFHPDERVLVFADGAMAGADAIGRLVGSPAPALLTLGEAAPPGAFERIDARARWAGLALVSGDMLRKTVAMLGDWDLHSTLLRRAVGGSARRIDIADGAGLGEPYAAMLVRSRGGARAATEAAFAVDREGEGWPARLVYGPLARLVAGLILDRPLRIALAALGRDRSGGDRGADARQGLACRRAGAADRGRAARCDRAACWRRCGCRPRRSRTGWRSRVRCVMACRACSPSPGTGCRATRRRWCSASRPSR